MRSRGMELALAAVEPKPGDLVMSSDVDEIVHPEYLMDLKHCTGYEAPQKKLTRVNFIMDLHYYSFKCRHSKKNFWSAVNGILWPSTPLSKERFASLRGGGGVPATLTFLDSGWHCSSCFHTLADFRNKIVSFSHTEFGSVQLFQTKAHLVSVVRKCIDLFDRPAETYMFVEPEAPPYVMAHADTFD